MTAKAQPSCKINRKPDSNQHSLNAAKMIDAAFARRVKISVDGTMMEVSVYRAIVMQLAKKAPTDRRSLRVLSRYSQYAKEKGGFRRVKLVFGPRAYEKS